MSAHQSPILSAASTPLSSEAGSMCPHHQVDSGESGISRISLGEDGDVEMVQAEAPAVNAPAADNSLTMPPSAPSPAVSANASHPAVSANKVQRNPADVIKNLLAKRDTYLSLLSDMIVGTPPEDNASGQQHLLEVRAKVENLNRTISTLKHSLKLSGKRVTASIGGGSTGSSGAVAGGIAISKRDLPKFQFKSDSVKYFPDEESFDSIFQFLTAFERLMTSSGNSVESVWKQYLPPTMPYEHDMWLKSELLVVNTWKEAKDVFLKKFNSSLHRLSAGTAVHSSTMQVGETAEQYFNRFSRSCVEAGYDSNDTSIGDAFLNGFPTDWQIQVTTLLCNFYPGRESWTTNEVARVAANILRDVKCPISIVGRASLNAGAGANYGSKTKGGYPKERSAGDQQGHYCRHSESTFSRGKEEGKMNVPAFATQTPIYCVHCGKRWFPGHSCPEYYSAVKAIGGQKPRPTGSVKRTRIKAIYDHRKN
ncbi:hypothetical protein FB192DRAFT_1342724 [Mucor lusitanicus]|uniref:Retrotransposon gag domain-containing protein n=1 Tax=Mucor circinelloides f. lusitanicus TaxID=29924 RepID=A0A8H4BHP6_MUCCL|nr:hypothetical protein FB192DRAFT_1342724 [Mucor lusitanicus]